MGLGSLLLVLSASSVALPADSPFLPVQGGIEVRVADSLLEVLENYSSVTGQALVWNEATRLRLLETTTDLLRDVRVPPDGVQGFVEGLLADRNFALSPRSDDALVEVFAGNIGDPPTPEDYFDVDEEQLTRLRGHLALLVRCRLRVDDAGMYPSVFRVAMPPSFANIEVGEDPRELSLLGFASDLADWVRYIRTNDPGEPTTRRPPLGAVRDAREGRSLTLDADVTLSELVRDCLSVLNIEACVSADDRAQLEARDTGLVAPVEVPAGAVRSFLETVLLLNGYTSSVLHAEAPPLLRLRHQWTPFDRPLAHALVPGSERGRATPATFTSTSLQLPKLDARQLPATLRPLMADSRVDSMMGNRNGLRITGQGWRVDTLTGLLRAVDGAEDLDLDLSGIAIPAREILPRSTGALQLGGARKSLLDLAVAYAALLDTALWISPSARAQMASSELPDERIDVRPAGVHAFFDGALFQHGLALSRLPTDPVVLAVTDSSVVRGSEATCERQVPVVVDVESLEGLGELSTLSVLTVVPLRTIDARRVPATVRPVFGQYPNEVVVSLGNSPALLVQGAAPRVRWLIGELMRQDADGSYTPEAWIQLGKELESKR